MIILKAKLRYWGILSTEDTGKQHTVPYVILLMYGESLELPNQLNWNCQVWGLTEILKWKTEETWLELGAKMICSWCLAACQRKRYQIESWLECLSNRSSFRSISTLFWVLCFSSSAVITVSIHFPLSLKLQSIFSFVWTSFLKSFLLS